MSEDFWFVKGAIAVLLLLALVLDTVFATRYLAEAGLAVAAALLVLDARRDRDRDFSQGM